MKSSNRIPIIVESSDTNIPKIDKKKFLVPNDITCGQFLYVIRKYEDTKFINSKRKKDLCYLNIYYNFVKLYASIGRLDKSKELIYKILKRTFLFNKIHYVLISLIFLYIYPEIIHKYFQKYNNNI